MASATPLGKKPNRGPSPRQKIYSPFWREFPTLLTWTYEDEVRLYGHYPAEGSDVCVRTNEIGYGSRGKTTVHRVLRTKTGALLAGKHTEDAALMADEARNLQLHAHPQILKFEGLYEVPGCPDETLLLTELCAAGTLQAYIDRIRYGLTSREVLRATDQIARALAWLHGRGVYHSDFKPSNVFIRSLRPLNLALGDLADLKEVGAEPQKRASTAWLWSPQIWEKGVSVGPSDDIWALGLTFLAMCGQLPDFDRYEDFNGKHTTIRPDVQGYPDKIIIHVMDLKILNPTHPLINLAARMLAEHVEDRATAAEVAFAVAELLRQWESKTEWEATVLNIEAPEGFVPK